MNPYSRLEKYCQFCKATFLGGSRSKYCFDCKEKAMKINAKEVIRRKYEKQQQGELI